MREAIGPEGIEPSSQLDRRLGSSSVQPPGAVTTLNQEPGGTQNAEMLRDRRPRDIEAGSDLPGWELAIPHERQDLPPSRLGQCVENQVHG